MARAKRKPRKRVWLRSSVMVEGIRVQAMRELDPVVEREMFSGGFNSSARERNRKRRADAKSYWVKGAPNLYGGIGPDTVCVPRFAFAGIVADLERAAERAARGGG